MDILFSVNELSKITGVSSRNIRYYDQIGLFKCSGTHENGYRYYTIDKIEEINSINHLRHMGISIKEIKKHMQNKGVETYGSVLLNHLNKVTKEIEHLKKIEHHIKRRISTLDYVSKIPSLGEILVQSIPERMVIKVDKIIKQQIDWELSLLQITRENELSHDLFVGDLGFVVDLEEVNTRNAQDFIGLFLMVYQEPNIESKNFTEFPAGNWLTVYVQGGHYQAKEYYKKLIAYAKENNMVIDRYATERMLIDHYISDDVKDHITEIMIPIISENIDV